MAMQSFTLGNTMIKAWQSVQADEKYKERFGDAMYNAMMAIQMNQESDPDGTLGRKRFHEIAGEMFDAMMERHSYKPELRMRALATAIIEHIQGYAEIKPLSTTSTPNDGAGHIHNPITVRASGKIE